MSGNSASLYFYCLYFLSFPDYLSACPLSISSFEKFWENVNIKWVLENIVFWSTWKLWRNVENFENIFEIFWNDFVESFIGVNLKILILRKLRRILKMFFSSFSEILLKKSGEYFVQIFRPRSPKCLQSTWGIISDI